MSAAKHYMPISIEDYLREELRSDIKHEYLNGQIYSMAGATNAHNRIASRVLGSLYKQLDGSQCEAFNSDTKIRIERPSRTYFYYPDASVVCQSNPDADTFQEHPKVVVEVLSEATRRIDDGEKRDNYLSLESLDTYILLEQESITAIAYQRSAAGEFERLIFTGPTAIVPLRPIGAELRLSEIYAGSEPPGDGSGL